MIKNIAQNLAVFLMGIIVIFALGEIFVIAADKYKAFNELDLPRYRTSDPVFHHRFIPSSKGRYAEKEYKTIYRINSFGLRDREYPLDRTKDSYRVIMLGDSFVEGRGVNIEDTFTKKIERLLNENSASGKAVKYEIINAGVASYSPALEYLAVRERLINLNPDLVILCLDLSDMQDDHTYAKTSVFDYDGSLIGVMPKKEKNGQENKIFLNKFLERHSPFYLYARGRISKLFVKNKSKKSEEDNITFGDIETDRLFMLREGAEIQKHWELTADYILKIKNLLDKKGSDFILLTYPYGHQVQESEWSEGRQSWGFKKGMLYNNDRIFDLIRNFCDQNKISLIQVYEDLRKINEHPLYYKYDGHFTILGNNVMAGIIYNKLLPFLKIKEVK